MSTGCILKAAGYTEEQWKQSSGKRSVAVFPDAAISVEVVWLGAFTLDTGTIHGSDAAQLVVRVTPATQTRLKTCEERKKEKN